jgi:hypothetical protein
LILRHTNDIRLNCEETTTELFPFSVVRRSGSDEERIAVYPAESAIGYVADGHFNHSIYIPVRADPNNTATAVSTIPDITF